MTIYLIIAYSSYFMEEEIDFQICWKNLYLKNKSKFEDEMSSWLS